jgi:hypothetical protein
MISFDPNRLYTHAFGVPIAEMQYHVVLPFEPRPVLLHLTSRLGISLCLPLTLNLLFAYITRNSSRPTLKAYELVPAKTIYPQINSHKAHFKNIPGTA